MTYSCSYCNRQFHTKQNYDKHDTYCKWLHTSNIQKTQEYEAIEKMTEKQKNKLIIDLLHKHQVLSAKVDMIQKDFQNLKTKQRISMTKWLDKSKTPSKSFLKWIESIPVTQDHLEKVFSNDLLHGVMDSIKEEIAAYKYQNKLLPVYAFTQKNKTLYIYDSIKANVPKRIDNKDKLCWCLVTTAHLNKAFSILNQKFEDQYKFWQQRHSTLLEQSEEWKEKDMLYVRKVMGMMDNQSARLTKLKQWLYTQIHLPFQEVSVDFSE